LDSWTVAVHCFWVPRPLAGDLTALVCFHVGTSRSSEGKVLRDLDGALVGMGEGVSQPSNSGVEWLDYAIHVPLEIRIEYLSI